MGLNEPLVYYRGEWTSRSISFTAYQFELGSEWVSLGHRKRYAPMALTRVDQVTEEGVYFWLDYQKIAPFRVLDTNKFENLIVHMDVDWYDDDPVMLPYYQFGLAAVERKRLAFSMIFREEAHAVETSQSDLYASYLQKREDEIEEWNRSSMADMRPSEYLDL